MIVTITYLTRSKSGFLVENDKKFNSLVAAVAFARSLKNDLTVVGKPSIAA